MSAGNRERREAAIAEHALRMMEEFGDCLELLVVAGYQADPKMDFETATTPARVRIRKPPDGPWIIGTAPHLLDAIKAAMRQAGLLV